MPAFVSSRSSASITTTSAPVARTSTLSLDSGPAMVEWDVIQVVAERGRTGQREPRGGVPDLVARPRQDHDPVAEARAVERQRIARGGGHHADDVRDRRAD